MSTATKRCKVCGAEYEYCHTFRVNRYIFRWQDVACCPEHGSVYFAQIAASRSNNIESLDGETENESTINVETEDNDLDEEFDESIEEEFDEDEEDLTEEIITEE